MGKIRRILCFAVVLVLLCTVFPGNVLATDSQWDEESISATQAVVYDSATDTFLYEKAISSEKVFPASITKVFSAYVALQYMAPETEVTSGSELEMVGELSSIAAIPWGETITVEKLVEGMLLPSGNDASYILATAVGRKLAGDPELTPRQAVQVFVDEMNAVARELGLQNTHFMNPDGYHEGGHYSSIYDLIKIAEMALEEPVIAQYAALYKDRIFYTNGQEVTWRNTNELLNADSRFYREDACGLKTGYTGRAGNCLLSAFRRDEGYILVGVFGCPEDSGRFADTITLVEFFGK